MSSVTFTLDASEWNTFVDNLIASLNETAPYLYQGVQQNLIPALAQTSSTNWNVRTGLFSGGWSAAQSGPNSVTVINAAPYSMALETGFTGGWTHKTHIAGKPTMQMALQSSFSAVIETMFNSIFNESMP